jgi:hypothetical protein
MNTTVKIVAWWLACSMLAVFISMGFLTIRTNLQWDQQSPELAQTKDAQVRSPGR